MPGIENNSPADQSNGPAQDAPSGNSSTPDSGVNWSSLADDSDAGSEFDESPQFGQPQPTTPPAPVASPAEAPKQTVPVVSAENPPQKTQPPASAQQVSEAPQQAAQAPAPAVAEDDIVQLRQQYQETLRSKDYTLSPEDALAFVTEPETAVPRFAAQLHMRVMQDVGSAIRAALSTVPTMMEQMVTSQQQDQAARSEFYGEWPGLEKHHDTVLQVMQLVRNAQPAATKEQVIRTTGILVATQLGVDPSQLRKQSSNAQQPPVARQQTQLPPQPAGLGSSKNVGTGPQQSVWESLALLDDDI